MPQAIETQQVNDGFTRDALQDSFFTQPAVLVGLIAQLTGLSLQDDIALAARRLQQLGHDILHRSPHDLGGRQDAQTPLSFTPNSARCPCSSAGWISAWSVSGISISSAHEACALYLFLVTVADAQGLSYYSERSLCRRLSMVPSALHRARQTLIQLGLLAYDHPLYQVLALDAQPQVARP